MIEATFQPGWSATGLIASSFDRSRALAAQTKPLDQLPIAIFIFAAQVGQQAAPATHQFQQTTARVMIVRVSFQMFNELINPLSQEGNLHLGGAGVGTMNLVIGDDTSLFFFFQRHRCLLTNREQAWRSPSFCCKPGSIIAYLAVLRTFYVRIDYLSAPELPGSF